MDNRKLKVVHYLNQYFGGVGGEDKADVGPRIVEGPTGPGRAFQAALGERGEVVATAICGDNYVAENVAKAAAELVELLRPYQPDLVIAGPAFEAGRYGVACGAVSKAVTENLGVPAVTGMYDENPGVDLFHKDVFIVRTGSSVRTMNEAVSRMVGLALKLVAGQTVGTPSEEHYIPRGIIVNETSDRTGAERAVAMLLNKVQGRPFESEVSQPKYDRIAPASPIKDIASAVIALVTDGGLVPRGNPDKIESGGATHFGRYSLKGLDRLRAEDLDVNHAGYDAIFVRQDPNRLVPLDVMRDLEREHVFGRLHDLFYATTGVATTVENARKMGSAIAAELRDSGVDGVILTSTWGTSTRCGSALAKEIERVGIPTAHVCTMTPVAEMVGSTRVITGVKIVNPMGNADLGPEAEKALRRDIAVRALQILQSEGRPKWLQIAFEEDADTLHPVPDWSGQDDEVPVK